MYAYKQTDRQTCIHTYIHTYMHTYIFTMDLYSITINFIHKGI